MFNYLYVDLSNVWIEGMHLSAVVNGYAPDVWSALDNHICDYSYRIDLGRLFQFAGGQKADVGRAVLFGSGAVNSEILKSLVKTKGFEVIAFNRNIKNREKKIDTSIVTEILCDSYERMKVQEDVITLVAGDSDYVPMVERLKKRGFSVHVVFWGHASNELRQAASKFINLNSYREHLQLKQK